MTFLSSLGAVSLALLLGATAFAEPAPAPELARGIVKKIDLEQGKMTISHGPLAKLDMPPMTMVFRVADPALLNQAKVGDAIRFDADKINGAYTVLSIAQEKVAP